MTCPDPTLTWPECVAPTTTAPVPPPTTEAPAPSSSVAPPTTVAATTPPSTHPSESPHQPWPTDCADPLQQGFCVAASAPPPYVPTPPATTIVTGTTPETTALVGVVPGDTLPATGNPSDVTGALAIAAGIVLAAGIVCRGWAHLPGRGSRP